MIKEELAIVDTVATKFDTHVLDTHTLGSCHVLLTDADKNCMDTFVLASYKGLSKHNAPLGMDSRLGKKRRSC